jgi:hypothetical protein
LLLFGETVAVCCEKHTEQAATLCQQNAEFLNSEQLRICMKMKVPQGITSSMENRYVPLSTTPQLWALRAQRHLLKVSGHPAWDLSPVGGA